jgi:hypothetical protein
VTITTYQVSHQTNGPRHSRDLSEERVLPLRSLDHEVVDRELLLEPREEGVDVLAGLTGDCMSALASGQRARGSTHPCP